MPIPAELRQHVNDLAVRLVVEGTSSEPRWMESLERIQALANEAAAGHVAALAGELVEALRQGGDAAGLERQIGALQQALDNAETSAAAPAEMRAPAEDPELIADFVLESREHLTSIESQALALERDPSDTEALNSAFRGFHTIKGLAGFLELWHVQELAHQVEAVLDRARNGQLILTPASIDVILQAADYLRRWMAHIEKELAQQPSEPPARDEGLLARIGAICAEPAEG